MFKKVSCALVLAAFTPPALALEDHAVVAARFDWIPLPATVTRYPEIGPYKDHYFHKVEFSKGDDGKFTVALTLPENLSAGTGKVLHLKQVARNVGEGTIDFASDAGKLYCYENGSWEGANCRVYLNPLPIPQADLGAYAREKFRGTERMNAMGVVAERLGPEPIGRISFNNPDGILEGSSLGNGKWQTRRQLTDGSWETSIMTVDFYSGTFDPGGAKVGLIGGHYYEENVMTGGWNFDGTYGWFHFELNGDSFTGTYGIYENDDRITLGEWSGIR